MEKGTSGLAARLGSSARSAMARTACGADPCGRADPVPLSVPGAGRPAPVGAPQPTTIMMTTSVSGRAMALVRMRASLWVLSGTARIVAGDGRDDAGGQIPLAPPAGVKSKSPAGE